MIKSSDCYSAEALGMLSALVTPTLIVFSQDTEIQLCFAKGFERGLRILRDAIKED